MGKAPAIEGHQALSVRAAIGLTLVHPLQRGGVDGLPVKSDFSCNATHGRFALLYGWPTSVDNARLQQRADRAAPDRSKQQRRKNVDRPAHADARWTAQGSGSGKQIARGRPAWAGAPPTPAQRMHTGLMMGMDPHHIHFNMKNQE
ncbi:hypothetical protein [Hydrogenophaga sp. R2]|uniref:hypothetical protein n=1 Tax=Hydrogenophaga sp. R2 TaxID=3132827 RepID=UPI003CF2E10F